MLCTQYCNTKTGQGSICIGVGHSNKLINVMRMQSLVINHLIDLCFCGHKEILWPPVIMGTALTKLCLCTQLTAGAQHCVLIAFTDKVSRRVAIMQTFK